jgi:hypothetical protein
VRVLIDNCLPVKLRDHIGGHTVETATYRGWGALSNGDLIAAIGAGFDAVVSIDQGTNFERAISRRPILGVLLPGSQGSRLEDVLPLVDGIEAALDRGQKGSIERV